MFSRRKKNYTIFVYTALIVMICILIVALLWPQNPEEDRNNPNSAENVKLQNESEDEADKSNNFVDDNLDDNDWAEIMDDEMANRDVETGNSETNEDEEQTGKDTSTETAAKSYYIVRKEGDYISVFFVDSNGKRFKLEDTAIVYDVLTLEDQKRFDKGIIVEKQEQLASLLQDFEG